MEQHIHRTRGWLCAELPASSPTGQMLHFALPVTLVHQSNLTDTCMHDVVAAHLQPPPGHLWPTLTVLHSIFGMAIKEEVQSFSCCCRSLRFSFSTWQAATSQKQQKQLKLAKAAAFFQNAVMASAWNAWQQALVDKHKLQDKLVKAVGYFQHAALAAAWAAWHEGLAVKRERQDRLAQAVAYFQQGTLAAAWNAWRQEAFEKRLQTDKLIKAVSYFQHMTAAAAFNAWHGAAAEQQDRRQKLLKALLFFQQGALASAWNAWRQFVVRSQQDREKVLYSLQGIMHRELAGSWQAWLKYVTCQQMKHQVSTAIASTLWSCSATICDGMHSSKNPTPHDSASYCLQICDHNTCHDFRPTRFGYDKNSPISNGCCINCLYILLNTVH